MKKKILLILLLVSTICFSQQRQFKIDWESTKVLSTGTSTVELPGFNDENFSFDASSGLKFVSQWGSSRFANERTASISNIIYNNISRSELKDLDLKTIPTEITYSLKNSTSRGKNYIYLELNPIIKEGNTFKKITSFRINYQFSNGNASRSALSPSAISNSVLSSGSWYKFYVDKTGVFKLSKGFLESLGANLSNIDPGTIKIYGNGGAMIPYSNDVFYPFDLQENAIKFVGEEDGVFNEQDYILFYAEGPTGYNQESNTNINIYSDRSYYFLNISSGLGKRIQSMQQPDGEPNLIIDTFNDYKFHELDEYNLVKAGRRWFGDRFDIEPNKSFEFEFPNLVTSSPIQLKVYAAAVSESQTSMQVNVNGSAVETLNFSTIDDDTLATEDWVNNTVSVSSNNINISLEYNNNGNPSALAYLDYISIEALRNLTYAGEQFIFKNSDVAQNSGIGQYNISNTGNITEVWDITDKYNAIQFDQF